MQSKIDKINTILEPILSSPSSTSSSNSAPTKAYLDLVAKLTSTNELIALKEGELKGISASETKQGMNVNDKGEVRGFFSSTLSNDTDTMLCSTDAQRRRITIHWNQFRRRCTLRSSRSFCF